MSAAIAPETTLMSCIVWTTASPASPSAGTQRFWSLASLTPFRRLLHRTYGRHEEDPNMTSSVRRGGVIRAAISLQYTEPGEPETVQLLTSGRRPRSHVAKPLAVFGECIFTHAECAVVGSPGPLNEPMVNSGWGTRSNSMVSRWGHPRGTKPEPFQSLAYRCAPVLQGCRGHWSMLWHAL